MYTEEICMKKLFFLFILFFGILQQSARAAEPDSVRVSLLTCAPGTEIYALFGHTAIRVQVPSQNMDWVYNYGMFNFNTPHFVLKFITGQTDYQLGVVPYVYFAEEYAMNGSFVIEQELNLRPEEKLRLVEILQKNYLPANRIYRYNYFYDNCTTRARDKIEQSIQGKVIYPVGRDALTFRQIIHRYTKDYDWDQFGIDLCLGSAADKAIDTRSQMFAPFIMMAEADGATIQAADGTSRPLVAKKQQIIQAQVAQHKPHYLLSPMMSALLVLVAVLIVSWLEVKRGMPTWWFDLLLFGLQGGAGCIIAFLFFFSVHPTVDSNWLLWILNPIPLVYLPFMIYKSVKGRRDVYHIGNIIALTLFIVFWWLIPQKMPMVIVPLAFGLLIRSAARLWITRKHKA